MNWVVSLIDFYFRRKVLGRPIPLIASFKVTYRCNLRCAGCPFHQRSFESGTVQMTWREATEALSALSRKGTRIVVFEGGEPFLWRDGGYDFSDLVAYAKKRFLRVAATTNGIYPLNVPAHIVWVSFDGLKAAHDRLRSDSFDRVWSNLQRTHHHRVLCEEPGGNMLRRMRIYAGC